MMRGTQRALARSFRANLKYPSLVSYNKLPWEVVNHDSTKLHMHVASNYEQLLMLATVTNVPHLVLAAHLNVPEAERLRVMPGVVYLLGGCAAHENPSSFTAYRIADPTSLQYYGRIHHCLAPIQRVDMCTSPDLRLLCLAIHFEGVLANTSAGSTLERVTTGSPDGHFSLFYFFRPNRPANELTQPFEKFYQHRPSLASLAALDEGSPRNAQSWTPVLQLPRRTPEKARLTPAEPYRPPQNYLMGLAERLGVLPGSSFGRRSLMWGTWF
ncbi:hypothetical protein LSCM1_07152 [Leishmania martiniquensis]|uniref:Uncharacterized protein n=1 Tax=Leishmania martiniquensis TaxID=1580590 RepID=A0A836HWT3_9TRYP|nr:hypothetical protein LSCM1_07152 [Leishmania martiniquensis]